LLHDLTVRHVMEDPHRLVLAADHPLARAACVDLADLRDEAWIFARSPLDPCDRALVAACAPLGFRPRPFLNTDDYGPAHAFVAVGACVTLIPELGLDDRPDVVVKETVQDVGSRSVQFVHLASAEPPELVGRLRDALIDQSHLRGGAGQRRPVR
jgi:DNA-binding transcriptional LysR family regulator